MILTNLIFFITCEFVEVNFSMEFSKGVEQAFHNLTDDEQNAILDYELMVYVCDGNERERLEWFRIINIAGEYLPITEMQADHIIPWWKGGTTTLSNLQMISKTANARKGGRTDKE